MIFSVGQKSNRNMYTVQGGREERWSFQEKGSLCPQAPRIAQGIYAILGEPKISPAMAMVMSIYRTLSVLVLSEIVVTEIRNQFPEVKDHFGLLAHFTGVMLDFDIFCPFLRGLYFS